MGITAFIVWLIIGGIIGWLASMIMKTDAQQGILLNIVVGIVGSFIGGWLIALGTGLPAEDDAVDAAAMARAVNAATETLQHMGGAQAGDKTMLDTLIPFSKALSDAAQENSTVGIAWAAAMPAAATGMLSTVDMISRRGRASRLGERSRGTQDAGATSIYYVLQAFGDAFNS